MKISRLVASLVIANLLLFGSCLAFEVESLWEIPLREYLSVEVIGNVSTDVGDTCSFSVYKGYPFLEKVSFGSSFDDVDGYLTITTDSVMYARNITASQKSPSTPLGYTVCLKTRAIVGHPRLEFLWGDSGGYTYQKQIVPMPEANWQCLNIGEEPGTTGWVGTLTVDSPVRFAFKCYNCEAGVNEVGIGYNETGSSVSANSTDGGATWTPETQWDYAVKLNVYYNPSSSGFLVKELGALEEDPGCGTTLRGIPFLTDMQRFQSKLILDSSATTTIKVKAENPFVVDEVGYYKVSCGENFRTGVFRIIPSISSTDGLRNLIRDVGSNINYIVVALIGGLFFAVLISAFLILATPFVSAVLAMIF